MNTVAEQQTWLDICALNDIPPNTGVCAQFNGQQVAIFHLSSSKLGNMSLVKAVSNLDPFSDANVLSRGLISENDDIYYVASPLLKQLFNLDTGLCATDENVSIATYHVRVSDGLVQLRRS